MMYVGMNSKKNKNTLIDYKNELNSEQLAVVLSGGGAGLVLAGAGSGKTRTITYRVAYLIDQGVSPLNILLLTFTNKAAKEMLNRVETLLGTKPVGLWGGTFHSVANRILRTHSSLIGLSSNFTIIDQDDVKTLIKVCIKDLNIDTSGRKFPSPSKINSIISYSRNSGLSIKEVVEKKYSNFFNLIPSLQRIEEIYTERKKQADSVDFDDLLIGLRDLLQNNKNVRAYLADKFHHVLVDEFQDTNIIQAQIIKELSSVHGNLIVVGDDAQSIYSFRAAQIKNILDFSINYSPSNTYKLTTNYRSTPEILEVANVSIENNKDQFKKDLSAVCSSDDVPSIVPADTAKQEAEFICKEILKLNSDGISLNNIAVLFRAAFHSQALEFELIKRDVPYEYRGGLKFFERAHVKDIVCHLRIKLNIKDESAWMRVLGLQTGIGLVTAQKIIHEVRLCKNIDDVINASIKLSKKAQFGWDTLCRTLNKINTQQLPSDLIRSVASGDYKDYLENEYTDYLDRLDDIEQFAIFSEGYSDLQLFLDEISLVSDYDSVETKNSLFYKEKIILSTIHQSKGLEWDAVFVMSLVDGKFPNQRSLDEEGGLEEERRLFYVATTRARKRLYYTYSLTSGYDSMVISKPSMFLQELPDCLFKSVKLKKVKNHINRFGDSFYDEPTVVFDKLGDVIKKKESNDFNFLRDIDDL